jgi:hypothetical protein
VHAPLPTDGTTPTIPAQTLADFDWLRGVKIGGGVILWGYQPLWIPNAENDVSIYFVNLLLDGKWGRFGLHLEPRFRDTPLRPFFAGPVWVQEAYGSVDLPGDTELRVGKTYSRLGLFWDNSFYGNVQVYDGLKLDPDYGLSLSGTVGKKDDRLGLGWWAQYFVVDGSTNVSLEGRDTISIPGARRRNQAIGRLEPRIRIGSGSLALGASGEFLQAADLPGYGTVNVWRAVGDAKFTAGDLGVWVEFTHQDGRTVTAFPFVGTAAVAATATTPAIAATPGASSTIVNYGLAGIEYGIAPVTARINASFGDYADLSVTQVLIVPGVAVALGKHLSLLGEFVWWRQFAPSTVTPENPSPGATFVDRSFNLTLNAHL